MPLDRRRLLHIAAAAGAFTLAVSPAAVSYAATTPARPAADIAPAADSAPAAKTLTLITGDKVAVTTGPDGRQSVDIVAATDPSQQFQISTGDGGDLYVYPSNALVALAAGTVDRELFNVSRMLDDGYGDATTDSVPAIVDFGGTPSAPQLRERADDLPGSGRATVMPQLGLASVRVDKAHAQSFWHAVEPTAAQAKSRGRLAASGTAGVARLWYDGKVRAALDRSVPQIGAPQAWAEGYDGKGVKVAVLDTGADLNHPDLRASVVATQSFISGQAVQDGQGHGTHVASTIAGSGAASGGTYKGVAPGAGLLVGKVLSNTGQGTDSSVLAGMEWAVAQGADIVSMSLGGDATPGGDVLTEAVDSLSASSGALFVIAAGNEGPGESTLGSPGTADSALTVGAVDKSDVLADFSSRGPRLGDMAVKPDVTAPGVDIVAARAAGTTIPGAVNVGESYTTLSGTSMATPHVAGAAAILAQRHPEWDGQRIKSALTAHAVTAQNSTVYQQGAGRIDIPAALDATLEVSGSTDFGDVPWQTGTLPTRTRTVTFRNTGTSDAHTTLAASVAGAGGALTFAGNTLDGDRLTVPAGGTAEVTVTLDPNGLKHGLYSGSLTATGADGASVHTAVGFRVEPPQHDVTLKFADRFGNPAQTVSMTLQGLDNDYSEGMVIRGTGSRTFTLPVGHYTVQGAVTTIAPGGTTYPYASDLFAVPDIVVTDEDQTLTVDATAATDLKVDVTGEKRPLEDGAYFLGVQRDDAKGRRVLANYVAGQANTGEQRYGAIPSARAAEGSLVLDSYLARQEPLVQMSVTSPERRSVAIRVPQLAERFEGTRNLRLVDAGTGSDQDFAGIDAAGKAVLVSAADPRSVNGQATRAANAGAAAMIVVPATPGPRGVATSALPLPAVQTGFDDGQALRALLAEGPVTLGLRGVVESGYTYSMPFTESGRIPADLARTVATDDFARVKSTFHSDETRHFGYEALHAWAGPVAEHLSVRTLQPVNMGGHRDDYVLAGPDRLYQRQVYASLPKLVRMVTNAVRYPEPGTVRQERWFAAPLQLTPFDAEACAWCRTDTVMRTIANDGGDSDPTHILASGLTRKWTYYRNGERITSTGSVLVPERADYRFVLDLTRTAGTYPGGTLGTGIHTEWSFSSAVPTTMAVAGCGQQFPTAKACESVPVVLPSYEIPVNELNQAPADAPFTFTVKGGRPKGWSGSTAIAGAEVSVSYDNGATWRPAEVQRDDDDSFRVSVTHPELSDTAGHVSVRTELWDADGNRTLQTLERAYALS
ncbi:S8 family serine peptidase [Streptomyces sp. NPDC051940]|uniref:S8 family peptidase n=1 Tax=Streptomyces sp. NPDC051940 TaxID=3155675 RepID=UPI0034132BE4